MEEKHESAKVERGFRMDTHFVGKIGNVITESVLRMVLAFCSFSPYI